MAQKFKNYDGPPPSYPQEPAQTYGAPSGDPRGANNYYGSPAPQQQYGAPAQYGQPQYYGGPPQQGYNQGPYQQQPMMYQQQGGYYGGRPQGGRQGGAGEGICAGIMGALACCCCLDCLF